MFPLLRSGDVVWVERTGPLERPPRQGEIVAARPSSLGGRALVKRIAALPGDEVRIGDRRWRLADGQFFLLGERSEESLDSRQFGPVMESEMIGPVRLRLWPWRRFHPSSAS